MRPREVNLPGSYSWEIAKLGYTSDHFLYGRRLRYFAVISSVSSHNNLPRAHFYPYFILDKALDLETDSVILGFGSIISVLEAGQAPGKGLASYGHSA